MTKLAWGEAGSRTYQTGVDRGVLYPKGAVGVPWNGLVSVSEQPTGGEVRPFYIDGIKYLNIPAREEYQSTLTAFTYPDEFAACDGTDGDNTGLMFAHQRRTPFDLAYRTKIGNDTNGIEHGYKIHLIYNALAMPAARSYGTLNATPAASLFEWEITATPELIPGRMPTAHLIIDSTITSPVQLQEIERYLYGTDNTPAVIPSASDLMTLFKTPLAIFNILPDETTGIHELEQVRSFTGDLLGRVNPNIYQEADGSRLDLLSAVDGTYTLQDEN